MAELYDANIPYVSNVVTVTRAYFQQHPELLENTLKALFEGVAFILSPGNRPVVLNTIMKRLKISDLSLAEQGYQDLVRSMDRKLYPSMEGMRNIQRLMRLHNPLVGNVKIEDIVDARTLKRLDESGFIDRLYSAYGVKQ